MRTGKGGRWNWRGGHLLRGCEGQKSSVQLCRVESNSLQPQHFLCVCACICVCVCVFIFYFHPFFFFVFVGVVVSWPGAPARV